MFRASLLSRYSIAVSIFCLTSSFSASLAADPPKRIPWTTSRISGSPDPLPPYRVEPVFPKLKFNNPVHLAAMPGSNRFLVCEQGGKVFSFEARPDIEKSDIALDVAKDLSSWKPGPEFQGLDAVYGLTFHPKFAENRYCYIFYVVKGKDNKDHPQGSRLSRFKISDSNPPKIDPQSEKLLMTFQGGGHNGGCLVFGKDGYLYISSGDAASPNPPDPLNTGQDCSDLLSSVLRIDVDREEEKRAYSVPKDNPFVGMPNVRPEVWAFGFRNPWKMTFDRQTGDLWLGDVGWEMWEMIYKIKKGGNYGWSIKEGPQPIRPDDKIGPTPILPPTIQFPHAEAASITGGYVYRGKKWKDLIGAYICGDWMSRKFWATRFDADTKITQHIELAHGLQKIITFAEDHEGEIYFMDYNPSAGIYTLVPNEEASKPRPPFPRNLSETGLLSDVRKHLPAAGVYEYGINAEPWADHATMQRMVAIPGSGSATFYHQPQPVPLTEWFSSRVFLPKDGVLAKTFSLEMERGNPSSAKKLETQIFHFNGREWLGYTYRWNSEQTDATLVAAGGEDVELTVKDSSAPQGMRKQTWHFASRSECRQCHNPWAGEVLSFTDTQLRHSKGKENSLDNLINLGLISWGKENGKEVKREPLANPFDVQKDLTTRARSYLHINCSHCHSFGAGGSVDIELKYDITLKQMKVLDVKPVQGQFEIPDGKIIASGDPDRSILYYRISKQGRGRMPHIGSDLVDDNGVKLIRDWIEKVPGKATAKVDIAKIAAQSPEERKNSLSKLLENPQGALSVLGVWDSKEFPETIKAEVIELASSKDAMVRDLFERFVPESQKVKRLGSLIKMESLLTKKGDLLKGKQLFGKKELLCSTCHRIEGVGGEIGPDLSKIGQKLSRRQILESLIDPSKDIDPKFAAYSVEAEDGRKISGLIVQKTEQEVVVRDSTGKDTRFKLNELSSLVPSKKSLMPEQLLRDLTAEQAVDLLEYLSSLKGK